MFRKVAMKLLESGIKSFNIKFRHGLASLFLVSSFHLFVLLFMNIHLLDKEIVRDRMEDFFFGAPGS